MTIANAFTFGVRIRIVVFFFCFNALLYMSFSILRDDWRRLAAYHLYQSTSNVTSDDLGSDTVASNIVENVAPSAVTSNLPPKPQFEGKANATLVFLARNSDLQGVLRSMESVETHFNHKFGYPWILLNEEEFTEEFQESVKSKTNASVQFGLIPSRHWYQPDWIDEAKAEQGRNALKAWNVIYADSVSYRNMCRFNSGFFFHHPLLQPYRYYWRIEPDVDYFCQLQYDPFDYLKDNNKTYGFTIAIEELEKTVSTLWQAVKEFMEQYPEYIHPNNALAFLSDNGGETYNLCHFWSNFEIADMDFWRGEAYTKFFEFLDLKGGFYYERWGDAPIHSIAAALFLDKNELHFFNDIGYQHSNIVHCPQQPAFLTGSCTCNRVLSIDYRRYSCLPRYNKMLNGKW
ncbi:glycosyltransferase family 15 protein [Lentinula detonsa]|uniref:Glycosyltransferase family 15 protein n=1 Tax=Lentinula detonsa TaxID=2804962 RepID=A0AA38Q7K1_9AGAR|nr:glycosyltransferase family 15 protein [Lentinula detonsa]